MKKIILAIIVVALYSCATLDDKDIIVVKPKVLNNRIHITKEYSDYVKDKKLKVLLRVPYVEKGISAQDGYDNFYNDLEKKLSQDGFIVRDRSLVEVLLKANSDEARFIDLYNKIDTDVIIQINYIKLDEKVFPTTYLKNDEIVEDEENRLFFYTVSSIDAKVVIVKEGQLGAYITINLNESGKDGTIQYHIYNSFNKSSGLLGISRSGEVKEIERIPEFSSQYHELIAELIKTIKTGTY